MTANKMPEMPEAAAKNCMAKVSPGKYRRGPAWMESQMRDYGRACYLAGLEAAKACVADRQRYWSVDGYMGLSAVGNWIQRDETLTNLTALEQEAKE